MLLTLMVALFVGLQSSDLPDEFYVQERVEIRSSFEPVETSGVLTLEVNNRSGQELCMLVPDHEVANSLIVLDFFGRRIFPWSSPRRYASVGVSHRLSGNGSADIELNLQTHFPDVSSDHFSGFGLLLFYDCDRSWDDGLLNPVARVPFYFSSAQMH
ncbi:MAG: hypothetical protein P8P99_09390 [Maricaulis sp.]|nr:hypothetical protein [Maricaulis sp.]